MEFDKSVQSRWILSMILGGLSLLPLNYFGFMILGLLMLPVALGLSLGGILLGVLSIMAKERCRYLGLVGVLLSLVGPSFFIASASGLLDESYDTQYMLSIHNGTVIGWEETGGKRTYFKKKSFDSIRRKTITEEEYDLLSKGPNRVAGSINSPRPHTTGHTGP